MKLLVAFDGSESATRALEYAIDLTRKVGSAELVLVNVHPEPTVYGEIQVYVSEERAADLQRKHSEGLLKPAMERAAAAGVPASSEILVGDIAEKLAQRAKELGCYGIVMGTHGMSAIENLLVGSVATKVVHMAEVPVTLVK
jgi:nucleotide-binding universal stress UspA family protein